MLLFNVKFWITFISLNLFQIIVTGNEGYEKFTNEYVDGTTKLKGYLARSESSSDQLKGGVLIVHDWNGRDDFENGKADALARLGYVGFSLDLFGTVGNDPTENMRLIKPFRENKELLLRRLQLGLDELKKVSSVDKSKIAAIGFCFGGFSVLEMARNNMDVQGVVSFHGSLNQAEPKVNDTIKAHVLVLHGYEDPGISPSQVRDFELEMTERNADWQVHVYGNHTYHAFTEPRANNPPRSQYHPVSDKRSWIAMKNFLFELFDV